MTTFLVADDHVIVRLGLELLLKELFNEHCSITQVTDGNGVLNRLQDSVFDVLIMDMHMTESSGFVLLEKVLALQNDLKVLVLSVNPERFLASKIIEMGAKGFINKAANDQELKKAIQTITNGGIYLNEKALANNSEMNAFSSLSARELQVALLLLRSKGVLEVSNELGISPSATSTLKGRLFKKLSIDSLFELYVLARKYNMITDEAT